MVLMSDTLLMLHLDRLSIFMSSSSVKLEEDPMLDFLSKHVFLFSSNGDGGMKVTSFFSRGLMVTVISGCGLCGQKEDLGGGGLRLLFTLLWSEVFPSFVSLGPSKLKIP